MTNPNIQLLVNYTTMKFKDYKNIEEADIDEYLNQMKLIFSDEDNDFFEKVKAIYTSKNAIKLESGALIEDKKHKKWFINRKTELEMRFWERYKQYLLIEKEFSNDVVNTMDDILDKLTDLLGDPMSTSCFQRRGLIIGDVQSGKTSNYTGLICKAADANYKVVVLLTGTIENLRKQTQMRLDEGFVGFDSSALVKDKIDKKIGVRKFDPTIRAAVLTTTMDDFKKSTAKSLGFDLNSISTPVLFVVKKNVAVLKRLNKWLKTFNSDGETLIDHSLLLIDDEADNASVNTNPEDKDPTKINQHITELLSNFERASYVGFTATPYANIFIDPYSDDQMVSGNLFPKDYIYSLNPPDNYIGARNIFGEYGNKSHIVRMFSDLETEEIEEFLPMKHKKDHLIDCLPTSLSEAINVFLIGNVIRDLRGDYSKHRSMLVNVSRFTAVQIELKMLINDDIKKKQNSAKLYSKTNEIEAEKDNYIKQLKNTFRDEFSECEYEWPEVLSNLYKGIGTIKVVAVNKDKTESDKLNYEEYEDGLRVIAVGGLSLSRGLTLEGLMTSYLYRSTRMYDTLLQMGRWFGYRPRYDDLCRIYLTETAFKWYRHISDATDELRRDIKRYEDTGLTPLDFGLRVRSDINTLLVTARNKMRTADDRTCTISLSEIAIESTDIFLSEEKKINNMKTIDELKTKILKAGYEIEKYGNSYAFHSVPKDYVLSLLDDFELPASNEYLDPLALKKFISNYEGSELEFWDVGFVNGSSDKVYNISNNSFIHYIERSFSVVGNNEDIVRMSGKSRRLGNTSDGKIGIRIDNKTLKKRIFDVDKHFGNTRVQPRNLKQVDYFTRDYIQNNRRPLLNIYNVVLKYNEKDKMHDKRNENERKLLKSYKGQDVYGIGVGIPFLSHSETKFASYKVNRIWQELRSEYDIGEDE